MFRFLFFLFIVYLVYRALRYYLRIFMRQNPVSKTKKANNHEIIDVEYEEVKDEENTHNKK